MFYFLQAILRMRVVVLAETRGIHPNVHSFKIVLLKQVKPNSFDRMRKLQQLQQHQQHLHQIILLLNYTKLNYVALGVPYRVSRAKMIVSWKEKLENQQEDL